jgi:Zn finger protein HypA/HybF involved in hydrogenase expression
MKANVESDIYTCEVCKQVFKDSSFPAQCPRCQSSRISNADLERLTLPQLGLTLRGVQPTYVQNRTRCKVM